MWQAVASTALIAASLMAPVGDPPVPGDMDCACNFTTYIDRGTCVGPNAGSYPVNISIHYSSDAHSGVCDGGAPPCPTIGHCGGAVKIHMLANAFSGFVPEPPPNPVQLVAKWDFITQVAACGDASSEQVNIYSNPTQTKVCHIILHAFCTLCSDS